MENKKGKIKGGARSREYGFQGGKIKAKINPQINRFAWEGAKIRSPGNGSALPFKFPFNFRPPLIFVREWTKIKGV